MIAVCCDVAAAVCTTPTSRNFTFNLNLVKTSDSIRYSNIIETLYLFGLQVIFDVFQKIIYK
ncbi:MAG: hypothetical protein EAZ30_01800 [Betaproteobacteria bacterium]|nr:MAG: hypothetical protein EAZ30_01800 [Betaproteobacteria bacterium]